MRFTAAATVAGLAALVSAQNGTAPVYVTEVVTAFTTYCPEATSLTHNGVTYTVSEATTLTITNCPCTVTKPAYTSSSPVAPVYASSSSSSETAPAVYSSSSSAVVSPIAYTSSSSSAPVAPIYTSPASNATAVYPTGTGAATTSPSASSSPIPYTGSASKAQVAGAGVLALFGLVAAL